MQVLEQSMYCVTLELIKNTDFLTSLPEILIPEFGVESAFLKKVLRRILLQTKIWKMLEREKERGREYKNDGAKW